MASKLTAQQRHLARAVREAQSRNPWGSPAEASAAQLVRSTIARNLAYTLAIDNPYFDIPAFLRECGAGNN